jgi:hypothetical protein
LSQFNLKNILETTGNCFTRVICLWRLRFHHVHSAGGGRQRSRAILRFGVDDAFGRRLDQSFAETAGVKKLLTTVPVRKPNKQEWVRVHPAPEYREMLAVIELRDDRETYLLLPHIARELPGEFVSVVLYTAINRQDVLFLWPVKLPGPGGKQLEWHRSAAEAAELAMTQWVRVKANIALGAYEICATESKINDPQWTDLPSFRELVRIAFRNYLVSSFDHPVIKRLRGQI